MGKSILNISYVVLVVISVFCFSFFEVFAYSSDDMKIKELESKMQILEYEQKYEEKYKLLEDRIENFFDDEKRELEKRNNEIGNLEGQVEERWVLLDSQVNIFGVFLTFFSLIIGFVGFFGYKKIKERIENEIEKTNKELTKQKEEIEEIAKEAEYSLKKIKENEDKSEKAVERMEKITNKVFDGDDLNENEKDVFQEEVKKIKSNKPSDLTILDIFILGSDKIYKAQKEKDIEEKRKLFEDAIEKFDSVINVDKNNFYAYLARGVAKNELEQYKEAIEDFDRAIELDPQNSFAYINRGATKNALKKHEEAI